MSHFLSGVTRKALESYSCVKKIVNKRKLIFSEHLNVRGNYLDVTGKIIDKDEYDALIENNVLIKAICGSFHLSNEQVNYWANLSISDKNGSCYIKKMLCMYQQYLRRTFYAGYKINKDVTNIELMELAELNKAYMKAVNSFKKNNQNVNFKTLDHDLWTSLMKDYKEDALNKYSALFTNLECAFF